MHQDLLIDSLSNNGSALSLRAERLIVENAGDRHVVPCRNLELESYARAGHCDLQAEDVPRAQLYRYWGGEDFDHMYPSFEQVVWRVAWKDHTITVVHLQWETGCGGESRDWVVAETAEIAEAFVLDVNRKTHAPGNAILVFSAGRWKRSESLYRATQSASFDDLILADELKQRIREDFEGFLAAEERYERMGISWRRGALLIGPPGNGKTHCVRALVKELAISSLYVQSLSDRFHTEE